MDIKELKENLTDNVIELRNGAIFNPKICPLCKKRLELNEINSEPSVNKFTFICTECSSKIIIYL